tara:strand:- start:16208 stop:16891 length:684 start_codon:yes stop_codon:yes gene_type:complete
MKKLFVTINLGGLPGAKYDIDSSWIRHIHTNQVDWWSDEYPWNLDGFFCLQAGDNKNTNQQNKHDAKWLKWNLASMYRHYDVIVYADCNIDVTKNLSTWIDKEFTGEYEMMSILHPTSKSLMDEINLCKQNNRWPEENQKWEKCYKKEYLIEPRKISANGILVFRPTEKVISTFDKVYKEMRFHVSGHNLTRDQVIFPMVSPHENIKIKTLPWSTFSDNVFNIQYPT